MLLIPRCSLVDARIDSIEGIPDDRPYRPNWLASVIQIAIAADLGLGPLCICGVWECGGIGSDDNKQATASDCRRLLANAGAFKSRFDCTVWVTKGSLMRSQGS